MDQNPNVYTIGELIGVLRQQQKELGPDYLPRIIVQRGHQEPEEYLIEEVATVVRKKPGAVKALQARGIAAIRNKIELGAVTL